ncbi:MAG: 50S ribosomal protein L7/L12 [Candidatus Omnitrophica bacterium]|nr:50S ribosomal protein L7/L12 [Candidatus Omnitrophota bacterium]
MAEAENKTEQKEAQATQQKEEKQDKPEIKLSEKAEEVVKTIETMNVLELSNLVKVLEDKFGVSASMPVMAAGAFAGAGAAAGGAPEEEKTSFSVVLANVGANKIQVIKEIRTITNLGLKEAKDLVDSAPKPIKEDATKEEAEEIKKKLTAVGATIELK